MSTTGQLGWYVRRLMRMSPAEIVHRVFEQRKRVWDSKYPWRWTALGKFGGKLEGIPGLVPGRVEVLRAESCREAVRIRERDFVLLNRQWPQTPDWNTIWQLDPVSGAKWPGAGTFAFHVQYRYERDKGDVKYVWEINRLQLLPVLALAGEYALFSEVLDSWMEKNPPFQGINWTSGIEAATRVVSVLASLSFLDENAREELNDRVRLFLAAHLYWIRKYPSLYSSANNHRVAELVAQFLFASCARGFPGAPDIRKQSRAGLEDRMQHLFLPDGVGAEQSVTYAAYALEWFAIAGIAADATHASFSQAYKSRAARAADHLRWLMDDRGCAPAIGDGDETRVLGFRQEPETRYTASVVALVARWLQCPELLPSETDPHLRDLWGAAASSPAEAIPSGMRVFEHGGYTVFREPTTRGTLVCVFDHGPLGFESIAAHGHADALSVWLSWGDEPIIVDAGTYLYHSGGTWRDYFRSTQVHNTLCIENANQSEVVGPFNWSRHAHARLVEHSSSSVVAEHDGYVRTFGLAHRRAIGTASRGQLAVEDSFRGRSFRPGLRWRGGLTLAPGIRVDVDGRIATLITPKNRVLRVVIEQGPEQLGLARVPYSSSFGRLDETSRIEVSGLIEDKVALRLRIECLLDA